MSIRTRTGTQPSTGWLIATLLLFAAGAAFAQVPVDDDGNPIGTASPVGEADADSGVPALSMQELDELVGPIALYPDDLLAVVLPASTYPLEIVQAARFLGERESDSSLEPDASWDESITALLNYPEVLQMMNDDIDWTWTLGEAVVAQQSDVIAAVEAFRDRAYAAGNLKSDEHQTVQRNDDVIEIDPVEDDVIYVPYYEPEQVVVYQPRPVYHYYPRAYPVYYYPYPAGHYFAGDYFWGVTTAFSIGWTSNYLHVFHHSFHGHPYFGHNYYGHHWRRPSIHVFNSYYGHHGYRHRADRYRHGSQWRPRNRGGARPGHREARSRYYANRRGQQSDRRRDDRGRDARRDGTTRFDARRDRARPDLHVNRRQAAARDGNPPVTFRSRTRQSDGNNDRSTNRNRAAENLAARRNAVEEQNRRRSSSTARQRSTTPQAVTPRAGTARQRAPQRRTDAVAISRQRAGSAAPRSSQRRTVTVQPAAPRATPGRTPLQRQAPVQTRRAAPARPAPQNARAPGRTSKSSGQDRSSRATPPRRPSASRPSQGRRDSGSRRRNHR